ncbi:hypothetical protein JCM10207_007808 [Rhodosporidiobolus poonsookiae]
MAHNSDKFDVDEGIVQDQDIDTQLDGVLSGPDAGEPAEIVNDADEGDSGEFDGIKRDNIIDDSGFMSEVGQRNKGTKDYAAADAEADDLVADVSDNRNEGRSAVSQ